MGKKSQDQEKKAKSANKISRAAKQRYTTSQRQEVALTIIGTAFGLLATFVTWLCGGISLLMDQVGVSNGLAEFGLVIVVYVLYGMLCNLTMPSAAAQALIPPWVCDLWLKLHPTGAES